MTLKGKLFISHSRQIRDLESEQQFLLFGNLILPPHSVFRHILDMSEFPCIHVPRKSKLC